MFDQAQLKVLSKRDKDQNQTSNYRSILEIIQVFQSQQFKPRIKTLELAVIYILIQTFFKIGPQNLKLIGIFLHIHQLLNNCSNQVVGQFRISGNSDFIIFQISIESIIPSVYLIVMGILINERFSVTLCLFQRISKLVNILRLFSLLLFLNFSQDKFNVFTDRVLIATNKIKFQFKLKILIETHIDRLYNLRMILQNQDITKKIEQLFQSKQQRVVNPHPNRKFLNQPFDIVFYKT
ncbi:unnamed protein product [Paramecium sonneborni]|uniref:Uncharacterized protein n=1 Tax=Paramecium sonneborni TaxID=65129 RepID=A0A8S1RNZ6_9CILI|nr:unnamed protein product [Paramecium sonneborni]